MQDVESLPETKRSQVHSLPSDYIDVHPKSYDPDFISDISNKMQVPDRLSMDGFADLRGGNEQRAAHMMVPERIIVAGDEKHIGLKTDLPSLDLSVVPQSEDMSYVGLITPPRTLTLEERFPVVEDNEEKTEHVITSKPEANGLGPVPFTPGISPNDSLLLNEEDEATLLRTQVSKLTRRLAVMEQDNQRRSQRELFLYPAVFGYFLFKVFFWFFRSR